VQTEDSQGVANQLQHYGGLFIGPFAAEVFGDYGAGPNHVLPTGGTARYSGGLSVFSFLRMRTWMRVDDQEGAKQQMEDSVKLARLEGLEGHGACRLALPCLALPCPVCLPARRLLCTCARA